MKRAVLYARYSSDNQSEKSIPDQLRELHRLAERQGWQVVDEYTDAIEKGSAWARPGLQRLLRDAQAGRFDIVLAEALDRLSRDQEDTPRLYKLLTFADVRIVTLAEGEITQLHVGFKGTMNAMFLKDLADKTRRGLAGKVAEGKSGGGLSYGYRVVRSQKGEFEIVEAEKAIVIRIFRQYVSGTSPKAIAQQLNRERVRGPRGGVWNPSTISGNWRRGTGILNNELYIGRLVWNRLRYILDPTTRKRVSRLNPESEWVHKDVPHLRLLDDELWNAAKARQRGTRHTMTKTPNALNGAHRPVYLFSGLTKCSECGASFNVQVRDELRCVGKTVRGTCDNDRTITRGEIEARVLTAMRKFLPVDAFERFCKVYVERVNEALREQRQRQAAIPREIVDNERRQMEILDWVNSGFGSVEAFKREVRELEERNTVLKAQLAKQPERQRPALHARMADDFHTRTTKLIAALEKGDPEQRAYARMTLRGFIDKIIIPPGDAPLQLVGKLGELLSAATGWDGSTLAAVANNSVSSVGVGGCGPPQPFVPAR